MPNWCSTVYRIYSNKADEIYHALNEATRTFSDPEIWCGRTNWYGYLATYSSRSYEDYKCRGSIDDTALYDGECVVYMDTAWQPLPKLLLDFVHDYDENAEIIYKAEEPGGLLYCTNDTDETGCVYIDACFDELPTEWARFAERYEYCPKEYVLNGLEEMLGKSGTWEELTAEVSDMFPDAYVNFNEYEYVPLEDWE